MKLQSGASSQNPYFQGSKKKNAKQAESGSPKWFSYQPGPKPAFAPMESPKDTLDIKKEIKKSPKSPSKADLSPLMDWTPQNKGILTASPNEFSQLMDWDLMNVSEPEFKIDSAEMKAWFAEMDLESSKKEAKPVSPTEFKDAYLSFIRSHSDAVLFKRKDLYKLGIKDLEAKVKKKSLKEGDEYVSNPHSLEQYLNDLRLLGKYKAEETLARLELYARQNPRLGSKAQADIDDAIGESLADVYNWA